MSDTKKEKIVILGFGWVGQANAIALVKMGYPVFYYDIVEPRRHYERNFSESYAKIKPLGELFEQDDENTWYIVAVGDRVKEDGTQDISLIKKALEGLKNARGGIILRSTVLPQNLKELSFDFYVPEFLHEKLAVEECLEPFYFVLGKTKKTKNEPSFFYKWQRQAKKFFVGTPEQASYIKYLSNIWNALRIAFVNEFGSLIKEPIGGQDIAEIEKIIDFVFEKKSYLRFGKAFKGHCLPKDSYAFFKIHSEANNSRILQGIHESNIIFAQKERSYQNLPEWFSSWEDEKKIIADIGFFTFIWQKLNSYSLIKLIRKRLHFISVFIQKMMTGSSLDKVRDTWNNKARENARYFVNSRNIKNQDISEFDLKEIGETDYQKYLNDDELLGKILGHSETKNILEIGCGIGRMTEFFPDNFNVSAIDISDKMIEIAKKRMVGSNHILFQVCDGRSLDFPDNYFDLTFSYQVFQHIPSQEFIKNYFEEIARTLKKGGIAKIHLRTGQELHKWHWAYGVSLTPEIAKGLSEGAGLSVIKYQLEDEKRFWLWLKK